MRTRYSLAILAATALAAGAASAAEVKRSVEVDGDIAKVWADVGGWCAISAWHPALAKCEESEAGGQKRRTLTTDEGWGGDQGNAVVEHPDQLHLPH